ncbi:hypothetical protein [Fischerella thermalis]|uniref:hypothetical protein n=1 Tax=Fischerella thermalis TaxID=372787 RepID=UPI00307E212A
MGQIGEGRSQSLTVITSLFLIQISCLGIPVDKAEGKRSDRLIVIAFYSAVISSSANCLQYYALLLVIGHWALENYQYLNYPLPITNYQLPAHETV